MGKIHEVAARAGVSTSTVSRTFRSPTMLRTDTEKRVLEAARQLNYRPHKRRSLPAVSDEPVVPGPQSASRKPIGFQFFRYDEFDSLLVNEFYGHVLSAVLREAEDLNLNVILNTVDRHIDTAVLPKMIRDQDVAAVMLVGKADPDVIAAYMAKVPYVLLVDYWDPTLSCDNIITDGFAGTFSATQYLAELGHRRIGFLLGVPNVTPFIDRLRGYQAACYELGLDMDRDLVIRNEPENGRGDAVEEFLQRPNRPTAIVAANDKYARTVLSVARRLDLNVPRDLSVIGFDDVERSKETDPPLTTLSVNKNDFGRLAVRRLWNRLQAADLGLSQEPAVCYKLPAELILRESCAPPSQPLTAR